ncbi:MAG: ribose 5-phosphate isomerase B [Bacteroidota bacterium]
MSSKSIIAIASDHAGYQLKKAIKEHFEQKGYDFKDFGTHSDESVDYPDFAHKLGESIDRKEYERGITICGSGNGISMAANKHPRVRAALCWNVEIAELARKHNDANVCSLPARYISREEAMEILNAFLNTDFEGGRHQRRVEKISI